MSLTLSKAENMILRHGFLLTDLTAYMLKQYDHTCNLMLFFSTPKCVVSSSVFLAFFRILMSFYVSHFNPSFLDSNRFKFTNKNIKCSIKIPMYRYRKY